MCPRALAVPQEIRRASLGRPIVHVNRSARSQTDLDRINLEANGEQDVARIYETRDPLEARNLLAKYDVDYVYVGPRERSKHGEDGLAKFPDFMDSVFSQDNVEIYRVRQ